MSSWFSSLLDGEHSGRKVSRRHGFHGSPSSQSKNHANFSNEPPVTEFYDAFPAIHHLSAPSPHPRQSAASPPTAAPQKIKKTNPRSAGTPHTLRVSDIAPDLPYAVFLQNTPLLSDAVPRAMLWAGMRCPVGANGTMAFPIPHPCPDGHRDSLGWCGAVRATRPPRFRFRVHTLPYKSLITLIFIDLQYFGKSSSPLSG